MRTRVPVTGTRARCHQARSRDQRLVSRALNQHFNSNCHRFKSENHLAIKTGGNCTIFKKRSSVVDINLKDGKSGLLCFVTANYEFFVDDQLMIKEDHDLVYRDYNKIDNTTFIKNKGQLLLKHYPCGPIQWDRR